MFLVARVAKNQTGIENRKIKWDHVTDFFTDIKSYMFFILGLVANIPNGGISNVGFQPIDRDRSLTFGSSLLLSSRVSDSIPSTRRSWVFLREP